MFSLVCIRLVKLMLEPVKCDLIVCLYKNKRLCTSEVVISAHSTKNAKTDLGATDVPVESHVVMGQLETVEVVSLLLLKSIWKMENQ